MCTLLFCFLPFLLFCLQQFSVTPLYRLAASSSLQFRGDRHPCVTAGFIAAAELARQMLQQSVFMLSPS